MATTINLNAFSQVRCRGLLEQIPNINIFNVRFNPSSSSASIKAGDAVKIIDSSSAVPLVDVAAENDEIFGFVTFAHKDVTIVKGEFCEVALDGSVMVMEAGSALNAGAWVGYSVADGQVDTTATAGDQIGQALEKATAAGNLVKVLIKCSGKLADA